MTYLATFSQRWGLALAILPLLTVLFLVIGCARADRPGPADADTPHVRAVNDVAAGRYLIEVGGCNDCHTVGYPESGGAIPESEWLTGAPVGFRGPWGTTYAANLRLLPGRVTEDAFVEMGHTRQGLPPMPWPSLQRMSDTDLRAIYRYIESLGPKGDPMPVAIGPGQEPVTPYIDFVPQHLERLAVAAPLQP